MGLPRTLNKLCATINLAGHDIMRDRDRGNVGFKGRGTVGGGAERRKGKGRVGWVMMPVLLGVLSLCGI